MSDWTKLCQVGSEIEGRMLISLLEQNGIEAIMRARLPQRVYPGLSPIQILVPKEKLRLAEDAIRTEMP